MSRPLRPCLEHRCPELVAPPASRCPTHQAQAVKEGRRSPGTTAAWRKARNAALERADRTCAKCGRTQEQLRVDRSWLEVHHADNRGVRAQEHDPGLLVVLCRECHLDTLRTAMRPDWRKVKQEQGDRAEAEGRAARGE